MMKISTRGQYALMTMEVLAEQTDNTYVPMKKISHRLNLSVKYLEQILIQLSKAGLAEGLRGINGGYRLVKPVQNYTAGEILRAMEGNLSPRGSSDSKGVKSNGTEEFWKGFDKAINEYVDSVTLERITEKTREDYGYMYCI